MLNGVEEMVERDRQIIKSLAPSLRSRLLWRIIGSLHGTDGLIIVAPCSLFATFKNLSSSLHVDTIVYVENSDQLQDHLSSGLKTTVLVIWNGDGLLSINFETR